MGHELIARVTFSWIPNPVFTEANERWLLGNLAKVGVNGKSIIQMGGSTDYGYTALIQFVPGRDLLIVLLLNAHDSKYKNATHHQLSRNHILPLLLGHSEKLPNHSMGPAAIASSGVNKCSIL